MSKIYLNDDYGINLESLIESRMLVQANSGGGKSWANRRIIEQAFGKVQIIVIDPEGEFGNMRGKYDFVYVGRDGDAPAEPRSAALLAHRLLETKASAIVDIYELTMPERRKFVRIFFEAMVNAPKELWHDCLILLDEAHKFAPEKEQSESLEAVSDMASRGRKRGFCLIPATQRPAKLNKDVAAECNNKLIGRASLDIDRKRSAEELGFTTKEEILSLRNLDPGDFYMFGPAIARDVTKIKIGDLHVKPAKRGQLRHKPPAPTEKVRKMLAQFKDLPQEAAQKIQTEAELRSEIVTLKREIATKPATTFSAQDYTNQINAALAARDKEWQTKVFDMQGEWINQINTWFKIMSDIGEAMKKAKIEFPQKYKIKLSKASVGVSPARPPAIQTPSPVSRHKGDTIDSSTLPADASVNGPEQKILNAIAWMESIGIMDPQQTAVAFLAGYTFGGGGFNNPKGSLRSKGLIEYRGSSLTLTDAGRAIAQAPESALTQADLHRHVLEILPNPEKRVLEPLLDGSTRTLDELAQAAGYTVDSGGFNNPKGRLRSLGLVEYLPGRQIKAAAILFI